MAEDVVRAKKFELVDDYGNTYATLEQDQNTGSAALVFYDDDQVPRVVIGMNESRTGYVNLRDASGKGGIRVAVEENGTAVIRLRDSQDKERYNLAYSPPGASDLAPDGALNASFLDENGRTRVQLGITSPGGAATLVLFDQNGTEAASLTIADQVGSGFNLNDSQGRPRAGIMVRSNGHPALVFLDEDGHVVWEESS